MRRQTYVAKPGALEKQWRIVDAEGKSLGRVASEIAVVLMGKHRPEYTPHVDCGDRVIVINASKVGLTGRKAEQKFEQRYTGYPGGQKTRSYGWLREHRSERLMQLAVKRMLPKSRLGRVMLKNMKVYPGAEHPHADQNPTPLAV